jgi:hypothetical protein
VNVKELVFRGENETKMYACGNCGLAYSPKAYACAEGAAHHHARAAAETCCAPKTCSVCGVAIEKYFTMCRTHREQARLKRAQIVPAAKWSDPVFLDDAEGDWGDGFSTEVAALLAWWEDAYPVDDAPPPPAYCWPCKSKTLQLNPDSVLENAVDDMHDDAWDQIVAADELAAFIAAWNTKQTCRSWYPDYSRVIVLDEKRFKALLEPSALADQLADQHHTKNEM